LRCPWHGWRFYLEDGRCSAGRDFNLHIFPVMVKDDWIWVDLEHVMVSSDGWSEACGENQGEGMAGTSTLK
jgi:hypothetical protein